MIFNDLIHNYSYSQLKPILLNLYPKEKIFIDKGLYYNLYNYILTLTPILHNVSIKIIQNIDMDDNSIRYYAIGKANKQQISVYGEIVHQDNYLEMEFAKIEDWLGCQYILDNCTDKELICHVLYEISYLGYDILTINQGITNVKNYMQQNGYNLHDIERELQYADE